MCSSHWNSSNRGESPADVLIIQAELGQAVAMLGFVAPRACGFGLEEGGVGRGDVEAEVAVHVFDAALGVGGQAAVVDDCVRSFGVTREDFAWVEIGLVGQPGHDFVGLAHTLPGQVALQLPAHVEQLEQAGDGLVRVTVEDDEAGVGESFDQRLDATTVAGVLAQVDALAAIDVELAAHALLVEFHHAAPAGGGTLVDVEEIELAHVGQLGEPEAGGAGVEVEQVVFFRDRQPHLVDVLRRAELALLPGLQLALEHPAEHPGVDPGREMHKFFLQQ